MRRLAIGLIILVSAECGAVAGSAKSVQNKWQLYTSSITGLRFQYPKQITLEDSTDLVLYPHGEQLPDFWWIELSTSEWKWSSMKKGCAELEKRKIADVAAERWCFENSAAGSSYRSFMYTFPHGNKTWSCEMVIRFSNVGYSESPDKQKFLREWNQNKSRSLKFLYEFVQTIRFD